MSDWDWKDEYKSRKKKKEEELTIHSGMSEIEIDEVLRKRIEKRRKAQADFVGHLIAYLGVNGMLWFIFATSGSDFPWPIFATLGWGIGLASHAYETYLQSGRVQDRITEEVEREKARLGLSAYQKPKRVETSKGVRLSDDGELVPVDSENDAADQELRERRGKLGL
jgi:hypothetical protein